DLKPDNIFLTNERVKILDFGIAKVMTSAAGTKTGSLLGTPMFMAPEQAKAIGPPVDIYALGAILYNMVCGRPPFEGDLTQLLTAHLFEMPVKPSERGFEISPDLEELIMVCLEKEPEKRPQKMMEVRDKLTGTTGVAYKSEPGAFRSPTAQQSAVSGSQPGMARSPTAARAATSSRPSASSSQAGTAPTVGQSLAQQSTLAAAASEKVDAPAPPARKSPLKIVLPAAAGVIAIAAIAAVLMKKPPPAPPPPVVAAAPAPKPEAKPALPPEAPKVHIKLKLDPPDARVELDGIATTGNPLELPESETTHTLVISAPGKQTVTREVRAMTSGEIYVQLPAEAPKPAAAHHAPAHHEPAQAPARKVRGPVETDL